MPDYCEVSQRGVTICLGLIESGMHDFRVSKDRWTKTLTMEQAAGGSTHIHGQYGRIVHDLLGNYSTKLADRPISSEVLTLFRDTLRPRNPKTGSDAMGVSPRITLSNAF